MCINRHARFSLRAASMSPSCVSRWPNASLELKTGYCVIFWPFWPLTPHQRLEKGVVFLIFQSHMARFVQARQLQKRSSGGGWKNKQVVAIGPYLLISLILFWCMICSCCFVHFGANTLQQAWLVWLPKPMVWPGSQVEICPGGLCPRLLDISRGQKVIPDGS